MGRERWVDILSSEQNSNSVRLDNKNEERYYFEAEVLADKLLGLGETENSNISSCQQSSFINDSLPTSMWKAIGAASSVILIGIPVAALLGFVLSSNTMQNMLASIQSSITPYLVPTLAIVSASFRNFLFQMQAIVTSMPYLLRNLNHVKIRPLPFLYKLIRKCIIMEAWRHIWVIVYKPTRYLWKGTLKHSKSAYDRFCPAWIRRGVKSMFHGIVQGAVQAQVGGIFESAFSGVTFESWSWSSGPSGGSGDIDGSSLDFMVQDSDAAMKDVILDSMLDSDAAQSLVETAIDDAGSAVEDMCDAVIAETSMDALVESAVESSLEDVVDSMVDSILE